MSFNSIGVLVFSCFVFINVAVSGLALNENAGTYLNLNKCSVSETENLVQHSSDESNQVENMIKATS